MTPEQEMQYIVEKAGEHFHYVDFELGYPRCHGCMTYHINGTVEEYLGRHPSTSPTDLNELFRLAEKLGYTETEHVKMRCGKYLGDINMALGFIRREGDTPADALRTALFQAVKEN